MILVCPAASLICFQSNTIEINLSKKKSAENRLLFMYTDTLRKNVSKG